METLLTSVWGTAITVGAVLSIIILGIFFVAGLYKKGKDGEDDRLIDILKGTVDALEQKVDNQKKEHDETLQVLTKKVTELTKKVDDLEEENTRLVDILQGRDAKTQEFYDRAIKSFTLVETMNTNMSELMKALTEHFKSPSTVVNNVTQK